MTIAKQELSEEVVTFLNRRVRQAYPLEICGFIMNSADPDCGMFVFEVPNISGNPRHFWRMSPNHQRIAMANEDDVFAVWHTHPRGPDGPSQTDLKYTPPGLRCFVVTYNGIFEYGLES